ncbi:tRNA guanosine-2'-O-methyltransferase [Quillaja saponaria]|uniref:tRNA guanosine-2'-O-methyltransferase n=1 Tax=Quillaja saponaria TaxID=32244 RepID=A0AAD7VBW9_QUISA|nr:tRNA guanosine-2'-O-methyltransferase [Quillaja saponaria]
MSACKTLIRTSLSSIEFGFRTNGRTISLMPSSVLFTSLLPPGHGLRVVPCTFASRFYASAQGAAASIEDTYFIDEPLSVNSTIELPEEQPKDTVEHLLTNSDDVARLMKMERRSMHCDGGTESNNPTRWFPYLDRYKCGNAYVSSTEVLEAVSPYIMDARKERFRNVVKNRSYSVCLVVEGLSDFGNVSAAFRSADALGFQSVHVVSCDSSKRYKGNRHVSMGAEKWLDIELWDSPKECFEVLKSRGYRIATTHVGMDAVSIYDLDWSCPTAIVVGNENRGISAEALELSDLHCSIPMKGMVDSFNVSVAAGILMHHAVCDRTARLGCHGDLTLEESEILLAEFSLRHSNSALSIVQEYANRKSAMITPKL